MRRLLGVVLAIAAAATAAQAADLAHLRAQAGEYTDVLLADPALDAELRRVLGEGYAAFTDVMEVVTPSELIDGRFLMAGGCKAHECSDKRGLVVIDLDSGEVTALLRAQYGFAQTWGTGAESYIARWWQQ